MAQGESSTFDGILVIVHHFVFMHMRITPSEPHAYSAVQLAGYSYGLS